MICGHSRFGRRSYWHGFGLFSGQGRFFGPGEVRLALLSMLGEAPMHGYELMKRLEEPFSNSKMRGWLPLKPRMARRFTG